MSRKLGFAILAVCLGYGVVTALAPGFVDRILYQPDYASRQPPAGMLRIPLPEGGSLAAVYLPNPQAKQVLWFFHGNAEDLGTLEPFLRQLQARGYAVFACDYPGYGLSTGKPGEQAIYAANRAAARYLQESLHVPITRIIAYGRSLGGGPATELARTEPVAGLVLQSAFMSVYRVVTRWRLLPFDQFENLRKLPQVHCPVLVMHGTADEVIPFRHGQMLFAAAPAPRDSLWIEGAHHNDFVQVAGERYWQALQDFSRSLPAK